MGSLVSAQQDPFYRLFARAVQQPDERIDLGRAALLIAQQESPRLDPDRYLRRMDDIARRVRDKTGAEPNPYRQIAALNYVLFTQEGYRGNTDDYYDPRNSFLNEVMDRKAGIPITLCVLYMEVALRSGLALHGVGFPAHFLVKYVGAEEQIILDPFDRGEARSDRDLQRLLDEVYGGKVKLNPRLLGPASKTQILVRMLNNLKAIYLRREQFLKALGVVELLLILEPGNPTEIRDRGLLSLKLECFGQAAADLEAYARMVPEAEDGDQIRGHLVALKKLLRQIH
jgi:regulator of sirC expression with transglutaminase-like and TPR domain